MSCVSASEIMQKVVIEGGLTKFRLERLGFVVSSVWVDQSHIYE